MAKTLKDFLEGYLKVKSADEQKFIDKHATAKNPDRNGNGDDVFKGSTKTIDRRKDRKGYNPGEDEKVYEALKGNQHKIDANKNGKLDAHDFKLLRGKKKVAEEAEELDEISAGLSARAGDKADNRVRALANKRKPGSSASPLENKLRAQRNKFDSYSDKKQGYTAEEAEQIDELSKATLGSYVKKAMDQATSAYGYQKDAEKSGDHDRARREMKHKWKRQAGARNAIDRLTKEEAELDEMNYRDSGAQNMLKASMKADRIAAKDRAAREKSMKKEEVEAIDEISSGLASRYLQKKHERDYDTSADGTYSKMKKPQPLSRLNRDIKGTVRALRTIEKAKKTNEEAEQIDETAKIVAHLQKRYGDNIRKSHVVSAANDFGVDASKLAKAVRTKLGKNMLGEKLNMDKASMGDVITDFKDSNAPQFKGKSPAKRRVMAIAAKLTAERGGKPLNKEERLMNRLGDISESHQRVMLEVFDKLNEDNKSKFLEACSTPDGVDQMLDFAIRHRGE